nr:radical SAM protein [Candidatus Sigynarchaeota archaeon]
MDEPWIYMAGMKAPSLVDEPKKSVAVVYLQGCNFSCQFCHNSPLIPMPDASSFKKTPLSKLVARLEENFLIDGVIFTGGEPTLQPALVDFIEALAGKFEVLGVDTNGINPGMLEKINTRVSRIAMDVKASFERYPVVANKKGIPLDKIKKSIELLCERSRNTGKFEPRITFAPPLVKEEDIISIGEYLHANGFTGNFNSHLVIQQYHASDGVLETYRNEFLNVPVEELIQIGEKVRRGSGIPVAIRCQEKGYFEL